MLSLDRDIIGINNSTQKEPNIMSAIEKWFMDALSIKCLIHKSVDSFHHQKTLFYIQSERVKPHKVLWWRSKYPQKSGDQKRNTDTPP